MSGISFFMGISLGTSLLCHNGMPTLPVCPGLQLWGSGATCYHEGLKESNSHACRQKNQHQPVGRPHWESGLLSKMCPALSSGLTVFCFLFFSGPHNAGWNTGPFCTPRALLLTFLPSKTSKYKTSTYLFPGYSIISNGHHFWYLVFEMFCST